MKLFIGKVPAMAQELVQALMNEGRLEVEPEEVVEVVKDIESVLKEYIRLDKEITEKAREIVSAQKRDYTEVPKVKMQIARERNVGIGEQAIEYIISQIIEALIHSRHVSEVYGADNEIALVISPILKKYLTADEELDLEVRKRIKNLKEGSTAWEIQYRKVMEELRRSKGF